MYTVKLEIMSSVLFWRFLRFDKKFQCFSPPRRVLLRFSTRGDKSTNNNFCQFFSFPNPQISFFVVLRTCQPFFNIFNCMDSGEYYMDYIQNRFFAIPILWYLLFVQGNPFFWPISCRLSSAIVFSPKPNERKRHTYFLLLSYFMMQMHYKIAIKS